MLERYIPDGFSGAVSVLRGDTLVFQKAYGYADIPNEIPNTPGTRFMTASAGKAFVAAGIMTLIEDGRLTLQTTLGQALDFDPGHMDPNVTVQQLLSHTSGIPDYFDEAIMTDYADLYRDYPNYKIRASRDLLPLFIDKHMMYGPGARFQYNNSGYVVLGLVIESVTGQPFDVFLDAAVFKPLSMADTGYFALDRLPARCAAAYIHDEKTGELYTNIYSVDVKGTGAGGAFTTVSDVTRFWRGLRGADIVSREAFRLMTSPQVDTGEYGWGFWLTKDGTPYFQGSDPGVSFVSSWDSDKDMILTLVSNLGQDVREIHREYP